MTEAYSPEPGDIIWTNFDPPTGREQGGRRPAVVVSVQDLYEVSRFAIVCPITRNIRPFGSSIVLDNSLTIKGEVLIAQIRTIDTMTRPFTFSGESLSPWQLERLREKLADLLGIE